MAAKDRKPNILFAFADDWGRYAGCYARSEGRRSLAALTRTPVIDKIAREGAMFTNAFVPAPSCTPCRSSVLSGRYFWQTRLGAILQGAVFDHEIPTFPVALKDAGYDVGFSYKVWGPGTPINDPYAGDGHRYQRAGNKWHYYSFIVQNNLDKGLEIDEAKKPLLDEVRSNLTEFLEARDDEKPFFYWWGPTNTHRTWQRGSGRRIWGIEPDDLKGRMPDFFPDVHEVREDVSDYLGECNAFDEGLGVILDELERRGELDNTLVVVSGDHGIPGMPRAKCNLYDVGTQVPLLVWKPGRVKAGRVIEDMVNIKDLAPTFLDAAGVDLPDGMPKGGSLMPLCESDKDGQVDPERTWIVSGRERHVAYANFQDLPYPQRCLRTKDFLYIRNFRPERWPMGDPRGLDAPNTVPPSYETLCTQTFVCYADMDAGPTKAWMIHHRGKEEHRENFELGFGKRAAEELYDLCSDPHHMKNVADDPAYAEIRADMSCRLMNVLEEEEDPRVVDRVCRYEHSPYTDVPEDWEYGGQLYEKALERWRRS
jgi:N-sulfoglucosamine sulfohydrolase